MIVREIVLLLLLSSSIGCQEESAPNSVLSRFRKTIEGAFRSSRFLYPYGFEFQYQENNNVYRPSQVISEERFDFIVVGSGSAGSVLANRLSEVPEWNILLLEVGELATVLTDVPAIAPAFQFTKLDWAYKMERQDGVCLGCPDQRMHWPRGRALGGSTIINYMIHVRGNPKDYDRWAAMGNPGWAFKDVLPYFIKMEDANIRVQDSGYHQSGGYLSVGDVPHRSESVHAFVRAAQEAGHPYVDYNGKDQLGVSYVQANLRRGKRCSAEKAYLRPVRNRPNLKILTNARAVKVLIDEQTKTAYGVQYVKNRKYHKAIASKEVILSAGAFNSPQLLMLSGIGPKDHLQELNIPLVQDLPVGQKLYDHITFVGLCFQFNESIINNQKIVEDPQQYLRLIINGDGPLTTLGGVEALTYIKTNVSLEPDAYPDMELIFLGGSVSTDKGLIYKDTLSVSKDTYNKFFKPMEDLPVWQVLPMLIHPKSHGYLKLKSKNPYHWPKFYGNFFTDPTKQDIRTFIASIREVQRINESPSMQRYGSKLITAPVPGCESHTFNSDEYWECALRHITPTLHHQVATCKMGPPEDTEAVVDNKLRVYGIKNLRVADTSIIPLPLSAHTSVPAYMIGEKASDIIKEDWKNSDENISPAHIRRHANYVR